MKPADLAGRGGQAKLKNAHGRVWGIYGAREAARRSRVEGAGAAGAACAGDNGAQFGYIDKQERYAMAAKRAYAVVLEPEEEGGFTVHVPAFPEIVTYGKDEAEALAVAEDAIRLVIEDSVARGETLPRVNA
jgi:antitoxin HicB